MVLPAPECSECTRQNGISILSNGTIEYIFNEADPFYNYTCPEGYRCWSEDDSILELLNLSNLNWSNLNVSITGTNKGCCVPCAQEFACPEGTIGRNICPDGYLCDPFPTKCSIGEICSRNQRVSCTEDDELYTTLLETSGLEEVLDGTYCPAGSASIRNCPIGYYCPDAKNKPIVCPSGYFCPMKTAFPEIACPRCPQGALQLYRNYHWLVGFCTIVIFLAYFVLVLTRRCASRNEAKSLLTDTNYNILKQKKSDQVDSRSMSSEEVKVGGKGVKLIYESIIVERRGMNGKTSITLNDVSGMLQPKRICAILGESGAGKSTLLGILSGQFPSVRNCKVSGIIDINGVRMKTTQWVGSSEAKKKVGYVSQNDVIYHELTVYENLFWSARFQMSESLTNDKVRLRVLRIIDLLGLSSVRGSIVRCLSGGERRRVSIGVALMGEPQLLILDEPTSGLDASSSMSIMTILKKLANEDHLTILCSIHQPRRSIFSFFDDLILLSKGGNVAFNGYAEDALTYFAGLGFQINDGMNPADFLLDASTGCIPLPGVKLDDKVATESVSGTLEILPRKWKNISSTLHVKRGTDSILTDPDRPQEENIRTGPSPLIQFWYQLQRFVMLTRRNSRTIFLNTAIIGFGSGLISYLQGTTIVTNEHHEYPISMDTFRSLSNNGTLESEVEKLFLFSTSGPVYNSKFFAVKIAIVAGVIMALAAAKAMSDKREVVFREMNSGISLSAYFLACSSFSIIENGCQMLLAGVITYWMRVPIQNPLPYLLNFFMLHWVMVSWGHLISILTPPEHLTIIGAAVMLAGGLLCSGIAKPIADEDLYSSNAMAITAGLLSPIRFFVEGYLVSDLRCLPEQYGFTTTSPIPVTVFKYLHLAIADQSVTKRSCNGWHYGELRMFTVGLTLRTLTLILIHFSYKRNKPSLHFKRHKIWHVGQLIFLTTLFITFLTISIALILIPTDV